MGKKEQTCVKREEIEDFLQENKILIGNNLFTVEKGSDSLKEYGSASW